MVVLWCAQATSPVTASIGQRESAVDDGPGGAGAGSIGRGGIPSPIPPAQPKRTSAQVSSSLISYLRPKASFRSIRTGGGEIHRPKVTIGHDLGHGYVVEVGSPNNR